jgi:GAF domain-containing protein
VVPVWRDGRVAAVLDIDSRDLAAFDDTDRLYLETLISTVF